MKETTLSPQKARTENPIEKAVAMFKKWKGDRDRDYVYDEIHEFTVDFSRGELSALMYFLEENEKELVRATASPSPNRLFEAVPVSELPEKSLGEYALICKDGNYHIAKYFTSGKKWISNGFEITKHVTHWLRPLLSSSPKEEISETDPMVQARDLLRRAMDELNEVSPHIELHDDIEIFLRELTKSK